jgi:hypothetical protein
MLQALSASGGVKIDPRHQALKVNHDRREAQEHKSPHKKSRVDHYTPHNLHQKEVNKTKKQYVPPLKKSKDASSFKENAAKTDSKAKKA